MKHIAKTQILAIVRASWKAALSVNLCHLTITRSIGVASSEYDHMLLGIGVKIKLCVFLFVFLFSRSGWRSLCGGGLSQPNLWAGKWRGAVWLHWTPSLWKQWVTPAAPPPRQAQWETPGSLAGKLPGGRLRVPHRGLETQMTKVFTSI